MKRSVAVFFAILCTNSCGAPESDQPINFLLITADDLEWSTVCVYGSQV